MFSSKLLVFTNIDIKKSLILLLLTPICGAVKSGITVPYVISVLKHDEVNPSQENSSSLIELFTMISEMKSIYIVI